MKNDSIHLLLWSLIIVMMAWVGNSHHNKAIITEHKDKHKRELFEVKILSITKRVKELKQDKTNLFLLSLSLNNIVNENPTTKRRKENNENIKGLMCKMID